MSDPEEATAAPPEDKKDDAEKTLPEDAAAPVESTEIPAPEKEITTPPSDPYEDGDIVWAKLGSRWWPAEVTAYGPPEGSVKKPALVVVQFFEEDSYEYVKDYANIYYYNCERKNEFIRKGMDAFRANHKHMAKFPADVARAEVFTDGNPNILSDPQFAPKKKSTVTEVFFGSAKKTPKEKNYSKGVKGRPPKSATKNPKAHITHHRFLGFDDYQAHICIQYPGKDADNLSDDEIMKIAEEPDSNYPCSLCPFFTCRLEVMLFHVKCHIRGIVTTKKRSPTKRKYSPKKPRTPKIIKHVTSEDDGHTGLGYSDTTESDAENMKPKPKRRRKKSPERATPKQKNKLSNDAEKKKRQSSASSSAKEDSTANITTSELIADWSDDDDTKGDDGDDIVKTLSKSSVQDKKEDPIMSPKKSDGSQKDSKDATKDLVKSCFDFNEEEEEEEEEIAPSTAGRKIPRVIPPADNRKSTDEEDANVFEKLKDAGSSSSSSKPLQELDSEFKDLMDSTAPPELPEVTVHPVQNFQDNKIIKTPDKEVATKLTNPKKRFVKSFEDFEQLQNEQKKAQEEKKKLREEPKSPPKSPLKSSPRSHLKESPKSPNKQKLPDQKCITEDPEDEEMIIDDGDIKNDTKKIEEIILGKRTESSESDGHLKISNLKCKIMSKLGDDETESTSPKATTLKGKLLKSAKEPVKPEIVCTRKTRSSSQDQGDDAERLAPKKMKIAKYEEDTKSESKEELESEEESTKEMKGKLTKLIKKCLEDEKVKSEKAGHSRTDKKDKNKDDTLVVEKAESSNSVDQYFNKILADTDPKSHFDKVKLGSPVEKQSNESDSTGTSDNREEMSALSTLALISEKSRNQEKEGDIPKSIENLNDVELVTLDANPTVVSEKDLADAQVEITPSAKKPVTLTNFSMDFGDCNNSGADKASAGDANSLSSESDSDASKKDKAISEPETVPAKELTKELKKPVSNVCDLEEHIPSKVVGKIPTAAPAGNSSSKLLERLTATDAKKSYLKTTNVKVPIQTKDKSPVSAAASKKFVVKSHTVFKPSISSTPVVGHQPQVRSPSSKPIILSEKIIRPETTLGDSTSVSVQKVTSKRNTQVDFDEVDTFIIHKDINKKRVEMEDDGVSEFLIRTEKKGSNIETPKRGIAPPAAKKRGKAKILQQTIITPAGEIIQPTSTIAVSSGASTTASSAITVDDNIFDINSMPIVLSDQILTPESIENMPIFLSDSISTPTVQEPLKIHTSTPAVKKTITQPMKILNKSLGHSGPLLDKSKVITKTTKMGATVSQRIVKQSPIFSSKHGKFVIVTQPSSSGTATGSKYTVGKRQAMLKRASIAAELQTTSNVNKVQNFTPEPSGNKVMILTDQHGEQQRVLLTPAQQKMIGIQKPGATVTKTIVKSGVMQQKGSVASSSGTYSKTTTGRIASGQSIITSGQHILTPIMQQKTIRVEKTTTPGARKIQVQPQRSIAKPQQKTIVIKNQLGQTVKKFHGTDDALLDQQVAEQLEAIKASNLRQQQLQHKPEVTTFKAAPKTMRRSYVKKPEPPKVVVKPVQVSPKAEVPPLAPISPKKVEPKPSQSQPSASPQSENKSDRPLNQLVIQDALGNQTTITEGQILALPSETVDGQPQSYMLVTLDESGNLTPLNNEALMSLDPNLGLGDLGNTVLQLDQGAVQEESSDPVTTESSEIPAVQVSTEETIVPPVVTQSIVATESKTVEPELVPAEQTVVDTAANEQPGGQQLIVTGDPIAAQKFLESLTEGNTDLANILANAEGSILIHADGQQILINTDSDNNQMLLSVSSDNLGSGENSSGNPMFATQPPKNQDILAAALADTDVFQQDQHGQKVMQSQLSPGSSLYPMNVGNVLETSLTLNSPIMTPLEVPSTNTKKISDENDILSQVPKNVDLPITITDPNISHTVAQQQVVSMMASELQNNLELSLPISDAVAVTSTDMNSPNFMYSLPTLDSGDDLSQKPFNSSMPLLTEDGEGDDLTSQTEITMASELGIQSEFESQPEVETEPELTIHENLAGHSELSQQKDLTSHVALANQTELTTEPELAIQQELITDSELAVKPNMPTEPELHIKPELAKKTESATQPELVNESKLDSQSELTIHPELSSDLEPVIQQELSSDPEPVIQPEFTSGPEPVIQPESTSGPELVSQPELTSEPELVRQPELPSEPELVMQQELPSEPELVMQPELTNEPELVMQPDLTSESELTTEPELAIQPELIGEPGLISPTELTSESNSTSIPEEILDKSQDSESIKNVPEEVSNASSVSAETGAEYSVESLAAAKDDDEDIKIVSEEEGNTSTTSTSASKLEDEPSAFLQSIEETEGLCTLGGVMCSSLSEPPPDMLDLLAVLAAHKNNPKSSNDNSNGDSKNGDLRMADESASGESMSQNEDSCEIPVQPEIVASLDSYDKDAAEEKNCKFD